MHLYVKGSKFPTKDLKAAHAAVLFLDACKTWEENQLDISDYLKTIEIEDNNPGLRLYSFDYQKDERDDRLLDDGQQLKTKLDINNDIKHLASFEDIDDKDEVQEKFQPIIIDIVGEIGAKKD